MPLVQGEVKFSNPVLFSSMRSSSPRRQLYPSPTYKSSYSPSSSGYAGIPRASILRATSLDRNAVRKETYSSLYQRSECSSSTYKGRTAQRKIESSDILSRIATSSHRGVTSIGIGGNKYGDNLHERSVAFLTEIKDLSVSKAAAGVASPNIRRNSSLNNSSDAASSLPPTSPHKPFRHGEQSDDSWAQCRTSSVRRHPRFDTNHNLLSDDKPSTSVSQTAARHRQSSSSSSSPASSTDDVTEYSQARNRRSSTYNSTSGYASDNASPSSSVAGGSRPSRDGGDKGGLVGLRNLGNTCFMNSVLQCLSNTRPLLDYCLKDSYVSDINTSISSMNGALIKAFVSLIKSMWQSTSSSDPAVNPQSFKNQIQKFAPRFMGYSQQDAQEFLRYLLQGMHEDVNRITTKPKPILTDIDDSLSDSQKASESWKRYLRIDDSKILDIFVGQLKSTLKCTVCGHCSVTFDPFWDLSLPIPKASGQVRLSQCFDLFTKEEVLDGDEKPTCSKCKTRQKCTKSMMIYKYPRILVIHLKRFSPMERYRSKLSTHVDFPLTNLDLGLYASSGSRSQSCIYNLYAVSNHLGTIYSGHYTAYCKHPHSGEWHDFNDSRVSPVSTSSIVSPEAYVLFYELKNHVSRL